MKFKKIFISLVLLFLMSSVSWAEPFSSLVIPKYIIEIPAGCTIPDRSNLSQIYPRIMPGDSSVWMYLFKDRNWKYYDKVTKEEIYPYMEIVKRDGDTKVLLVLAFINTSLEIEVYNNEAIFGSPHIGKMIKRNIFGQNPIIKERR